MAEPEISGLILRHVVNCVELTGHNVQKLLADFGVARSQLDDPELMVPLQSFLSLLDGAARATNNPHFGLFAGRLAGSDSLGPIGFLFMSAPTLKDAFLSFVNFLDTMQHASRNDFSLDFGMATYRYSIGDDRLVHRRHDAEYSIAAMVNFARNYVGPDFALEEVRFEHPCHGDPKIYREFFRCPVYFAQDNNAFSFDSEFAAVRGRTLDSALFPIIQEHLQRRTRPQSATGSLHDRAQYLMQQCPIGAIPTAIDAAKQLAISLPTLKRHLAAAGTSWHAMAQDRKMQAAKRYFEEERRSVSDVALAIGYAESASFIRAYRRYFGHTPGRDIKRP